MLLQDYNGKSYMIVSRRRGFFERVQVDLPRKPMTFTLAHVWTIDEKLVSTVRPCLLGCSVCKR